jgi:hypothetical protein
MGAMDLVVFLPALCLVLGDVDLRLVPALVPGLVAARSPGTAG